MSSSQWLEKLAETEFPAIKFCTKTLEALKNDRWANNAKICLVIQADPLLSCRFLRRVNRKPEGLIVTVEHAVSLLGHNAIFDLLDGIDVADEHYESWILDNYYRVLRRSYHGAVFSHFLAERLNFHNSMEIYTAAMLRHLGELVLWLTQAKKMETLEEKFASSLGANRDRLAKKVFGFTFSEISFELAKRWHLPELLQNYLNPNIPRLARVQLIDLAEEFVQFGDVWDLSNDNMNQFCNEARSRLGVKSEKLRAGLFKQNLNAAKQGQRCYPSFYSKRMSVVLPGAWERRIISDNRWGPPISPMDIASPIDRIEALLDGRVGQCLNTQEFIKYILLSLQSELEVKQVVFCLLDASGDTLHGKLRTGSAAKKPSKEYTFPNQQPSLFAYLLDHRQNAWVQDQNRTQLEPFITPEIKAVLGDADFYVTVVLTGENPLGVCFAEVANPTLEANSNHYEYFKQVMARLSVWLARPKAA